MKQILFILISSLLIGVCSLQPAFADDPQITYLEDGTPVRYFTLEQARELAEDLAELDQARQELDLFEELVENQEDQIENLDLSLELTRENLTSVEQHVVDLNEVIDNLVEHQNRRVLFCRSHSCSYGVGVTLGVGASVLIFFLAR